MIVGVTFGVLQDAVNVGGCAFAKVAILSLVAFGLYNRLKFMFGTLRLRQTFH